MEGDFHFNSAIAEIMELCNAIDACGLTADSGDQRKAVYREAMETVILLLSVFTPHIAEELWKELGHEPSILKAAWPTVNRAALACDQVEVAVQVNGKVRDRLVVATNLAPAEIEAMALACDGVKNHIAGKTVRRVVVIANKLVNIAVS